MRSLLQLTLDLFDVPAPAPAPVPVAQPRAPAAPAEPIDAILLPASFEHPRANRRARLGDSVVGYEFKRARRRSIGFSVGPEGLVVSAPRWVTLSQVDAALQNKAAWVLAKLDAARERRRQVDAARIEWRDGTSLPYLGEPLVVVLDPRHGGGAVLREEAQALPGVARRTLHVALPQHASGAQIRDAVQAWLMRQAQALFTQRLDHFAPRLAVQWKRLALSNAGTRWGTARSDGTIRLNWRLVHFGLPVIDYVVAHELAHLRVMDHSPRFWDTVATVVPDYAQLRGRLRDEALPPW